MDGIKKVMAKLVRDITCVAGTYMKGGEEKKRYKKVGQVFVGDDGREFRTIDPSVNFAAFAEKGKDVFISEFDVKRNDGGMSGTGGNVTNYQSPNQVSQNAEDW